MKRGFIKGEATRLLRTNSSQTTYEECLSNFKLRLKARGNPNNLIVRSLTGVRFADRRLALQQQQQQQKTSFAICHRSPSCAWPKNDLSTKPEEHLYAEEHLYRTSNYIVQ